MKKILWIAGLALAGLFLLTTVADIVIGKTIEKKLAEQSVTAGNVRFRLLGGKLRIDGLSVAPAGFRAKRAAVTGIGLNDLKGEKISLGNVLLGEPRLDITLHRSGKKLPLPEQLEIKNLTVTDGDLTFRLAEGRDTTVQSVAGLNLVLKGILVTGNREEWRLDDLALDLDRYRSVIAHRDYTLEADTVRIRKREGTASVADIRLTPAYPKELFAYHSYRHTDWMRLYTAELALTGLELDSLVRSGILYADSLHFGNGEFASFKNRKIPVKPRYKPMIHEMIQHLPVGVSLRRIGMENITATYEELPAKGEEPGRITFTDVAGVFEDFTNISDDPRQVIRLTSSGKVMGTSPFESVIELPAARTNDRFTVRAEWGPGRMADENPMVVPIANLEIRSGEAQKLRFRMEGDSREADVQMEFLYSDLRIIVLRRHAEPGEKIGFLTDLLNQVVLRSDNPDRKGVRTAETRVARDTSRSAFNYLWKGVLSGVKKTVLF